MTLVPFPGNRRRNPPTPAASPEAPVETVASGTLYIVAEPVLPTDDLAALDRLRAQYHRAEAATIGAHFTIVFAAPATELATLTMALAATAARTRPFWFALRRLSTFAHPLTRLGYLQADADEGSEELAALHRALDPTYGREPYTPHVTLGRFDTAIEAERIARIVERQLLPIQGRIETLRLIDVRAGRVEELATVGLSGGA